MNEIIDFFRSIFNNDYLTLYVISIIPIIELRGAIVFMTGMFSSVQEMIAGMFCCVNPQNEEIQMVFQNSEKYGGNHCGEGRIRIFGGKRGA